MNINKKSLISNTALFIVIILFVQFFNHFFGADNSLIGIMVLTSALMLLQRDLTIEPIKNFLFILVVNLAIGILGYIAQTNIWLGIPANFIALFGIGYIFNSNIKSSVALPFGLLYLLALFDPVTGHSFSLRMAALACGAILVMLLQFIANKGKLKKSFRKNLISIIDDIILKVDKNENLYASIIEKINVLKKIIYDERKQRFFLSYEGKTITDIIYLFERINILLDRKDISESEEKAILLISLSKIKDSIEKNDFSNLSLENIESENKTIKEITNCLDKLVLELPKLETLKGKKIEFYDIPEGFKTVSIMKNNFNISSLKVSYALRLSVTATILIFIVSYFKIPEGKWIVYTIFSLTQPYAESSKTRVRQRVEGTLMGALIVCAVFFVIKDPTLRGMVVLLAGYLNPFAKGYKQMIVLVTITAIASVAMMGHTLEIAIIRVVMVLIGALISALTTKFLFPYSLNDANSELENSYEKIVEIMKTDIKSQDDENVIKSLYLMPVSFENKLMETNVDKNEIERFKEFIKVKRDELNELYGQYYFSHA